METVEKIIDNVECEVGGQVIDKQYGHWMKVYTDLTHNTDQAALLDDCVVAEADKTSHVPLQFWFCRNPGLALPLIALQYHEVKLNVTFGAVTTINPSSVQIWCDYVFLDTDERRRFAQVSHEYLIEQVQFSNKLNAGDGAGTAAGSSAVNTQHELRFNHPVKELVWTVNETGADDVQVENALLQLNGHDRFKRREGKYFTAVQRYQHHSGSSNSGGDTKSIPHVYSFGLKPEEHQPSGTCNFSRIDNAVLNMNFKGTNSKAHTLRVYAVNYNVLRIMSGMGGLAYSN